MRVFLSYSRHDAAFVGRLADDLAGRGIDPWLDTDELESSDEDRWRRSVVRGIRDSAAVILVLSPDSVSSASVERELTISAEIGRRIVPIICRACELSDGIMFELAGLQRTDFVAQPYETALDHLVRRIRAGATDAIDAAVPPSGAAPVESDGGPPSASEPDPGSDVGMDVAPTGADPAPTPAVERDAGRITDAAEGSAPGGSRHRESSERSPRRWVVIAAIGSVAAIVVALVVISLIRDDPAANPRDVTSTTAGSEPIAVPVASIRGPSTTSSTETSRAAVTGATTATTSSTTLSGDAAARALLDELRIAYVDNDWDTVRRLRPDQASWSDADFAGGYSGLQEQFFIIDEPPVELSPTSWLLTGTLFAWDDRPSDGKTTNVVCAQWTVDLTAGTVTPKTITGTDGRSDRREAGWVPRAQFPALTAEYCP